MQHASSNTWGIDVYQRVRKSEDTEIRRSFSGNYQRILSQIRPEFTRGCFRSYEKKKEAKNRLVKAFHAEDSVWLLVRKKFLEDRWLGVFLQKKETKRFAENKITSTFALAKSDKTLSLYDSVAQLVEQMTLNHWVESSSLSGVTFSNFLELHFVAEIQNFIKNTVKLNVSTVFFYWQQFFLWRLGGR